MPLRLSPSRRLPAGHLQVAAAEEEHRAARELAVDREFEHVSVEAQGAGGVDGSHQHARGEDLHFSGCPGDVVEHKLGDGVGGLGGWAGSGGSGLAAVDRCPDGLATVARVHPQRLANALTICRPRPRAALTSRGHPRGNRRIVGDQYPDQGLRVADGDFAGRPGVVDGVGHQLVDDHEDPARQSSGSAHRLARWRSCARNPPSCTAASTSTGARWRQWMQ